MKRNKNWWWSYRWCERWQWCDKDRGIKDRNNKYKDIKEVYTNVLNIVPKKRLEPFSNNLIPLHNLLISDVSSSSPTGSNCKTNSLHLFYYLIYFLFMFLPIFTLSLHSLQILSLPLQFHHCLLLWNNRNSAYQCF